MYGVKGRCLRKFPNNFIMKKCITITLFILVGFSACSPIYYSPNTQNVPMITTRGDMNLTLVAGSSNVNDIYNSISIIDLQSAYGITSHLSIQVNGGFFSNKEENSDASGTGRIFETGLGYFSKINNNFMLECYGVIGFGNFNNKIEISKIGSNSIYHKISGSLKRFGIQPVFAFKTNSFAAAISSRIVRLDYKNIEGYLLYDGADQVGLLNNNNSYYLFEPALSLKFGWEMIKFQLQYGRSFNLTNPDFRQGKDIISLGLNINLKKQNPL